MISSLKNLLEIIQEQSFSFLVQLFVIFVQLSTHCLCLGTFRSSEVKTRQAPVAAACRGSSRQPTTCSTRVGADLQPRSQCSIGNPPLALGDGKPSLTWMSTTTRCSQRLVLRDLFEICRSLSRPSFSQCIILLLISSRGRRTYICIFQMQAMHREVEVVLLTKFRPLLGNNLGMLLTKPAPAP